MATASTLLHPASEGGSRGRRQYPFLALFWLLAPLVLIAVGLRSLSGFRTAHLRAATGWFDPLFLLYNIALALFAVVIVPLVVYFYVRTMEQEKRRRLQRDLGAQWASCRDEVEDFLRGQFRFRNYLGSLIATMMVVGAGTFIILLLKPYFPAAITDPAAAGGALAAALSRGVDYSRGANILLLGPWIELYQASSLGRFYHQIVISLTAFQFGFLGAYVYFMGSLLRAYFTLDLTTHTLVAGTVRMLTSSVLALVLSFVLFPSGEALVDLPLRMLPVLAFFLGHFPQRALFYLESVGEKALRLARTTRDAHDLALLAGMSTEHETRLQREGFDNLENLGHADPIDLAVRTGFGYRQLRHWIGEARLRLLLERDYDAFADATWVRTADELHELYAREGDAEKATRLLASAFPEPEKWLPRLRVARLLLAKRPAAEPAA